MSFDMTCFYKKKHFVRWPSVHIQVKFYGDRPRKIPPSGELNTREVTKYSDSEPFERYISKTMQDLGAKLALITNG